MNLETLTIEIIDQIGVIRINRPAAMNALNQAVLSELRQVIVEIEQKRELRALVVTGAGDRAFVAGADIKELEGLTAAEALELSLAGQSLFAKIEDLPFPVIAALNGFALGGGLELALACDFIVATETAKWGLPEVSLGLIPGYGGTQRLARTVGRAIARRVILTGDVFSARQGHEWGVFTELTAPGEVMNVAMKLARTCAARAPRALAWAKVAINHGAELSSNEGMKLEAELFARTFETEDRREGVRAFAEKRAAVFRGI